MKELRFDPRNTEFMFLSTMEYMNSQLNKELILSNFIEQMYHLWIPTYNAIVLFYQKSLQSTLYLETIPLLFHMCSMTYKNYHKQRGLKQHICFFHVFMCQKFRSNYLDPLLRVSQRCSQGVSRVTFSSGCSNREELLPRPYRLWQTLFSCNYRTEVSTFLPPVRSSLQPLLLARWPSP